MIINIRGTSGSGKSTLVREVMKRYDTKTAVFDKTIPEGKTKPRKQPIGYMLTRASAGPVAPPPIKHLAVLGHYETACGGCDTIPSMDRIYDLVRQAHDQGFDVLYEGLLLSAEVNRLVALHEEGLPVTVVALDQVPLQECLDGVNDRRRERMGKKFKPVNPKNTESKFKGVLSANKRFRAAGVPTHSCDRSTALETILVGLGVS
jgi:ABC-type dipeptide/oligopeptide/nickel transport system ATPase component